MEKNVVLSKTAEGFSLYIKEDLTFEQVKEEIRNLFDGYSSFFRGQTILIQLKGRLLDEHELLVCNNICEYYTQARIIIDDRETQKTEPKDNNTEVTVNTEKDIVEEKKTDNAETIEDSHISETSEETTEIERAEKSNTVLRDEPLVNEIEDENSLKAAEISGYFSELAKENITETVDLDEVDSDSDIQNYDRTAFEFSMRNAEIYKGCLRSGQQISSDKSILYIGNVNPGAVLYAKGSIYVLGSLKGSAFAGQGGNIDAFVYASEMDPSQIQISDIVAMSETNTMKWLKSKKNKVYKETIAYISGENIILDSLSQSLNEIKAI